MLERNVPPRAEADYRSVIERDFADLPVESVKVLASGWDRVAVLANGEIVFRLPAKIDGEPKQSDVQATQREVALLRAIKGLPFSIPEPLFVAKDERYYGYRLLEGRRWEDLASLWSPSDSLIRSWVIARQSIARSLVVEQAEGLGIPRLPLDEDAKKAEPIVGAASNKAVADGLRTSIEYVRRHAGDEIWQFTHNDLNAVNILLDESGDNIRGVLDFGDAHIAPPSSDYYLWDKWPPEVMERVHAIAAEEGDAFDVELAKAIHRVYVANDIVDSRELQNEEAEESYWQELEMLYGGRWAPS
jgi:aminoglycoside phosphotransferase (APT) family kinase protein